MESSLLIVAMVMVAAILNILVSLFLWSKKAGSEKDSLYLEKLFLAMGAVDTSVKESRQQEQELHRILQAVQSTLQAVQSNDHEIRRELSDIQQAAKAIAEHDRETHREIGVIQEYTKEIVQIKNDITKLQDLLRSSRKRGQLGEFLLQKLLQDVLPPSCYSLQHTFTSGKRVDAIIRLSDGHCVAIDSKFPLTAFEQLVELQGNGDEEARVRQFHRDVCKHVDDIANKYIIPEEGTLNFALMFVPSEAVYYEIVMGSGANNSFEHAIKQRVYPVSPCTLYPYLYTIAQGLRGLHLTEHVQKAIAQIGQLETDLAEQARKWETARRQIDDARRNLGDVQAALDNIADQLHKIVTPA